MSGRPTHFEIYGDAPESLAAFYSAVFGWRVERAPGVDYWRIHLEAPDDEGVRGGGIAHRPALGAQGWLNFIEVSSVDEVLAIAQREGGRVLREKTPVPKTAWYAVVADPASNTFGIWQPDPKAMPLPEPD